MVPSDSGSAVRAWSTRVAMPEAVYRQFVAPPIYLQGPGAFAELPALAERLGQRPLIVTDPGVVTLMGAGFGLAISSVGV